MVNCSECGRVIDEGTKFCPQCGTPAQTVSEDAGTLRFQPESKEDAGALRFRAENDDEDADTLRLPPEKKQQFSNYNRADTAPAREPNRPTQPVGPANTQGPVTGPAYLPPVEYTPPAPVAPYQPPQPYPPPQQAGHKKIELGYWLSQGWHVYAENGLLMSLASLLGALLSVVTLGILAGPLLAGLYRMAFKTLRGERPEMSDLFNWDGRFLQCFLAFLIYAAIYGGLAGIGNNTFSALLSFVLWPLLTIMIALTLPLIVDRRMDVVAAMNEVGRTIFSRDAFMWWVVGLVFLTVTWGGFLAICLGFFVTLPWIVSSAAVAYRETFGLDDPNRTLH